MVNEISTELQTAIDAVRAAAVVCRNVQRSIDDDVLQKSDKSPVTVSDFASQAIVCRALAEAFPGIPVVGEEDSAELQQPENQPFLERIRHEMQAVQLTGSDEEICQWIDVGNGSPRAERYWTLDPIDGTKGFLRGDQYAVSLALLADGEIQLGVLGCPNLPYNNETGVMLFAERGKGAFSIPLDGDAKAEPIQVSQTTDPADARFCESFESKHSAHSRSARVADLLGIHTEPVRMDSQAKYAAVARGDADIYMRLPTRPGYQEKIWDHAGGVIVVEEAGGRVSDMHGQPLDWTRGRELSANRGVIVTNGRLHDRVIDALREIERG